MSRLIWGLFIVLFWNTPAAPSGSKSRLNQVLSNPNVQILNKDGTSFAKDGLQYHITFVAEDRIGTVEVIPYKESSLCVTQAHDAAKRIADELQSLGPDLGRDQLEVIPTSGKRRFHWKYQNGVAVVSIFKRENECDIFDRLTFFYWIPIKGKIKSKHISSTPDLRCEQLRRFIIVVEAENLEVSESDFQTVNKGDVVEVEYLMTNSFARIIRQK
jgi:hypothetical protein